MSKNPSDGAGQAGTIAAAADFLTESDPFRLFEAWYQVAEGAEPNDPNAMALATVDSTGLPNVRIVLLKGIDPQTAGADRGFLFYTNLESAKGDELAGQPKAALVFYWKSLGRQVRVRGTIASVSDSEADAYFASRPRGSQIGAWASTQSRVLDQRATLETKVADVAQSYEGTDVPRPPHWSGYRLTPVELEFWQAGADRLHDRRQFVCDAQGGWSAQRLWP